MQAPKHILVPTDFDDGARHAEELAIALAQKLDAKLTLLHVVRLPPYGYMERTGPALDEIMPRAHDALDAERERVARGWSRVDAVLVEGAPWEAIREQARTRGADMIVMGTHGRRGLPRLVLGSVAEKIVRTSSVPVVTVPASPRGIRRIVAPTDGSERVVRASPVPVLSVPSAS